MIVVSCPHCAGHFQVRDEFAGRTGTCPSCRRPLPIPRASGTDVVVPSGTLDGPASSLGLLGLDPAVTLSGPAADGQKSVGELLAGAGSRYVVEGEVARGGMGAVVRAVDRDLRREVAISSCSTRPTRGGSCASSRRRRSPASSSTPTSSRSTSSASTPAAGCSSR